ncbi:MAG: sodium:calcium antiporter [Syntrophales bacterium]|jgi:cation:H+ antiporter|nr:sodium:calcium antiporter [Syntrophales bacterium]MDY0044228.1 sodium:calcium antiporter [Syntrophales bacterium]
MKYLSLLFDEAHLAEIVATSSFPFLIILILFCIFILSKGADWMIDGAVAMAFKTGVSQIAIGATIISLGTTTPEAFVSVFAAWMGNPDLALGNGVGSIIVDTGLIFGLTCLIAATPANKFILNRTGWVQVGSATLLVSISLISFISTSGQPVLSRWVGVSFLLLLVMYILATIRWSKEAAALDSNQNAGMSYSACPLWKCWLQIFIGLALVITGARILIPSASELAMRLGVPNDVIAATMVALGTSLPELITAISAVRKGHPEITVGNIVGADVLNCLFVIGASASVSPLVIPANFFIFHFPVMLLILYSFRFFIFLNKDGIFRRWQGGWLVMIYFFYIIFQYAR